MKTIITNKKEIILILNDIRSAENVGAMFRTAEAAGVSKIYLSGYTPAPLDRFGRPRKDIAKSALGAENMVPWEIKKSVSTLIAKLKKNNFFIISLEQSPKSVDYKKIKPKGKIVLIPGNEVSGISPKILEKCDVIAEIPMHGKLARNHQPGEGGKESLNVSVALGIALFRICDL